MTPDEMVAAACALIEQHLTNRERLFVAIDGCVGAGKSALAKGIRNSIGNVSILRCDHFYRPLNEYPAKALSPARAYELYFSWERMRNEALVPLRRGEEARYQRYEWAIDALGVWIVVGPSPIVLVEGVYSSRPELRELLDAIIFVDAPREVRLQRMFARGRLPNDPTNDWMIPWTVTEEWYIEHIQPRESADLILENA